MFNLPLKIDDGATVCVCVCVCVLSLKLCCNDLLYKKPYYVLWLNYNADACPFYFSIIDHLMCKFEYTK